MEESSHFLLSDSQVQFYMYTDNNIRERHLPQVANFDLLLAATVRIKWAVTQPSRHAEPRKALHWPESYCLPSGEPLLDVASESSNTK